MKKIIWIGSVLLLMISRQGLAETAVKNLPMSNELLKNFVVKWEFYKLCQFGYDPESEYAKFPLSAELGGVSFDPADVKEGDLIFLRARYIATFFSEMVPRITVPFVIVAHGEFKDGFREEYVPYLNEPKLIAWFGTHPLEKSHHKFHTIPLGIWAHKPIYNAKDELNDSFAEYRVGKKDKLVYANFAEWTHEERSLVKSLFTDKEYVTWNSHVPFKEYIAEMAQHKFTLSPRGLGPDCYRTWEALLVGTIPIVKTSFFDEIYEGLPVLIVDNWEEVTEEYLEEHYEKMLSIEFDMKRLSIEYWYEKIEETKRLWQNNRLSFVERLINKFYAGKDA